MVISPRRSVALTHLSELLLVDIGNVTAYKNIGVIDDLGSDKLSTTVFPNGKEDPFFEPGESH